MDRFLFLDGEGLLTLGILIMIHFSTLIEVKEQQTCPMDFPKRVAVKNFAEMWISQRLEVNMK